MILMIDNYDSFTYNLVQYFGELGADVKVYRNDQITIDNIREMHPEALVISPGPCSPNEAGISVETVRAFHQEIPILGVCLGHQSIGQAFGGMIVRAKKIMHGKTSLIYHDQSKLFEGLTQPFSATRYHSLVIDRATLPDCFEISAWTIDESGTFDEIMAIRHRRWPVVGVQFHPESILSEFGHDLLRNFLSLIPSWEGTPGFVEVM